jgi:hypothetical protein
MDGPNNPRTHSTPGIRKGRFAYLAERGGGRTLWFDKIVWNNFGQPRAGPGARSAEG